MPELSHPVPTSAREAAQLARACVAGPRVATLVTCARHPSGQHATAVEVAARVGEHCRPVDPRDDAACAPDARAVLRRHAAALLAHLDDAHADLLLSRVRAAGLRAEYAGAGDLDACGLTLLAVSRAGVQALRLDVPAPVDGPEALADAVDGVLRR